MDVAVWQIDATLVVLVVSMVPRPLKQVVTVSPIVAVAKPFMREMYSMCQHMTVVYIGRNMLRSDSNCSR